MVLLASIKHRKEKESNLNILAQLRFAPKGIVGPTPTKADRSALKRREISAAILNLSKNGFKKNFLPSCFVICKEKPPFLSRP